MKRSSAVDRGLLLVLALVLGLSGALSVVDAHRDSATADEPIHVAAGASQATSGVWLVNMEHPPLAKELFGRAAALAGAGDPPRLAYPGLLRSCQAWLFADRPGVSRDRALVTARLAAVALFLATLLAAAWAAGGGPAGLLAVALLAGQTALVPHGHLANTDVPLVLFVALAAGALGRELERPSPANALVAIVASALAMAVKATGVVLVVLLSLSYLWLALRGDRVQRARRLAAAAAVPALSVALLLAVLHVWVRHDPPGSLDTLFRLYGLGPGDQDLIRRIHGVCAEAGRYALTVLFNLRQTETGRLSYFLGRVSEHPPAVYHLAAIYFKSPLAWILLVGAASAFRTLRERTGRLSRATLFELLAIAFLVAALPGPRLGVRHVLPSIALFSLAAGAALGPLLDRRGRRWLLGAVALALSPLLLGRSLGRHGLLAHLTAAPPLADSNLDWGQDLTRLATLLGERGLRCEEVSVAYFGGDLPSLRLPGCHDALADDAPLRRHVAVSRQLLLTGPGSSLVSPERAARAVIAVRRGDARFVARAGDSIDLFEIPSGGATPVTAGAGTPPVGPGSHRVGGRS